jgi:hypothetical protein
MTSLAAFRLERARLTGSRQPAGSCGTSFSVLGTVVHPVAMWSERVDAQGRIDISGDRGRIAGAHIDRQVGSGIAVMNRQLKGEISAGIGTGGHTV